MDTFEQQGMGYSTAPQQAARPASEGASQGTQGPIDIDTPQSHPDAESLRKSLQADYTRKTQQVAEQRRQLEAQMQQIAALQTQMQHSMMSQTDRRDAQQQVNRLIDRLPAGIRQEFSQNPNGQAFVESIEQWGQQLTGSANSEIAALKQELNSLKQGMTHQQVQHYVRQAQDQVPQVAQMFGQEFLQQHGEAMLRSYAQNPTIPLVQHAFAVNPSAAIGYARSQGAEETKRTLTKDAGNLAGFGYPTGMNAPERPMPLKSLASESVAESFRAANGREAMFKELYPELS